MSKKAIDTKIGKELKRQKAVNFIGTLNNPAEQYPDIDWKDYLAKWTSEAKATYVCGQLEKGENGTHHV